MKLLQMTIASPRLLMCVVRRFRIGLAFAIAASVSVGAISDGRWTMAGLPAEFH